MRQRIAKALRLLTRLGMRLVMALSPRASERRRCWVIAGMATEKWQHSVAQHLIAAGVSVEGARAELEAWAEECERIRQQERHRIASIQLRADATQGRLADKLIDEDVDTVTAILRLKQDRDLREAVNAIFTGADGGEGSGHGTR